ncbi:MAG: PA14 domain-containing protein, partial [Planctomycetota bacterium]
MSRPRRRQQAVSARRQPRVERLEKREVLAATSIQVLAAGLSGTENLALEVNGQEVRRWDNVGGDFNARQFETFDYTHPTEVGAGNIRVRMVDSGGANKDLRVDGIRINGVKYEAESPNTWATGTWDAALNFAYPRYAESEIIHTNRGLLAFSGASTATINVRAAGETNTETMRLWVEGEVVQTWDNVGGNYDNRQFATYEYKHPTKVEPEDVRIELVDGSNGPDGDKNLLVDWLRIDGRTFQTEVASTYGTGTYLVETGAITPGFNQSESLHASGFFQYAAIRNPKSTAVVYAVGRTDSELGEVRIDGGTAWSFATGGGNYNRREFEPYPFVFPKQVSIDDFQVAFVNDGRDENDRDRNLRIDAVELDGTRWEAEAITTFSTGTWRRGIGVDAGFTQDERLHANGFFSFNQDPADAGTLSLAETQYTVNEEDGFVDVEFVRTASRGTVTIDYTTVNGTAVAGQDFAERSGTLVIEDGDLSGTVRVPITNDSFQEGSEAFNVAADRVTGGAFLGQPRTTTVTILDDDAPNIGTGIGLLGQYYSGTNFNSLITERTDEVIGFNWGTGSPSPSVPDNNFSVRWSGEVQPLYSETYTFETRTDDGVRLWVNGQQIINQWVDQSPTTHTGTITLQAGVKYDIRMDYYENGGGAVAELRWSSASQAKEIIPSEQLYSELVIPDDGQFVGQTVIASGLQRPTAIDFSRIGGSDYMYIAQQDGRVRLAIDGVLQSGLVVDYRTPVNNVRDRGLLGMAVHPNLTQNPYIYLLYTYDPPETQGQSGLAAPDNFGNRGSRLTRLTLDASNNYRTVVPGSDVVLLGTNSTWENISRPDLDSTQDNSIPPSGLLPNGEWVPDILVTDSQSHTIGALDFGTDGSLFVTNGDGTSYGRVDPRTTRVQDLDSLSGKVLRIDPLTGRGYSDNPFFTGDTSDDRSKVYNLGLRNPFTLAVDPSSGIPYVGDVGWTKWEEINGGRGQNFGWPFYEGGAGNGSQGGNAINRQTGGYKDLAEAQDFYANGGDAQSTPPLWSRSHAAGGVAVVLGDFYTGDRYPSRFENTLFFTDYGDPTIRALDLNSSGGLQSELVVMGSVGTVVE